MPNYSILFPLDLSTGEAGFAKINDDNIKELARFNLKNIILTNPGERIMDINFGVGIKLYLFEQNVDNNKVEIENKIRSQTRLYAPYIDFLNIEITNEENSLILVIKYEVKTANIIDILSLTITI
jgi:phage baseplate assembly protein W